MPGDVEFAEFEHDAPTPAQGAVQDSSAGQTSGSTPDQGAADDGLLPTVTPQQGHFGFTLRELIIGGAWLLAFALSFVPGAGSILDITSTVWTMNGAWLLTIGVPTVATFLVVLRRLSPEGIRRVGSLGIDQFASVAYTVAAVSWAVLLWQQVALVAATRQSLLVTWAAWAELVLMLVLVVVTVFAGLVPGLKEDFEGRMETIAHRNADPVRPVVSKTRPVPARGSVADPQTADEADSVLEHDAGRAHEAELGAAGHVSAGTSVTPELDAEAEYVPVRRRGSFLASDESPDDAPAFPAPAGHNEDDEAPAQGEALDEAHADAPTEVFTAAILDEGSEPEADADDERNVDERIDDERIDERPDSGTEDESDAPAQTSSDTLTQVLGDLLVSSSADDVATRAVPVSPDRSASAESRTEAHPVIRGSEQAQPFWALAPDVRPVHDARGDEIFEIGPDAWILVLEDRGGAFVVRHDDGRVGYLHYTDDMTRG
jgi:hypothetical protein